MTVTRLLQSKITVKDPAFDENELGMSTQHHLRSSEEDRSHLMYATTDSNTIQRRLETRIQATRWSDRVKLAASRKGQNGQNATSRAFMNTGDGSIVVRERIELEKVKS